MKIIFQAEDGKMFEDEVDCRLYEAGFEGRWPTAYIDRKMKIDLDSFEGFDEKIYQLLERACVIDIKSADEMAPFEVHDGIGKDDQWGYMIQDYIDKPGIWVYDARHNDSWDARHNYSWDAWHKVGSLEEAFKIVDIMNGVDEDDE